MAEDVDLSSDKATIKRCLYHASDLADHPESFLINGSACRHSPLLFAGLHETGG